MRTAYPDERKRRYDLNHMSASLGKKSSHWLLSVAGADAGRREIRAGDAVFRQGESVAAIFVVEAGRVRLERELEDGSLVTVYVARQGDAFAEAAVFADCYHCHAIAEAPTRVLVVPVSALRVAIERDPDSLRDVRPDAVGAGAGASRATGVAEHSRRSGTPSGVAATACRPCPRRGGDGPPLDGGRHGTGVGPGIRLSCAGGTPASGRDRAARQPRQDCSRERDAGFSA